MIPVLTLAAAIEGATGAALLVAPSLVGRMLIGDDLAPMALLLARVAGIALIGLSVACWPGPPLAGMLTYNAGAMLYLAYVGFAGAATGILLWPAVLLHIVMTALLARATTIDTVAPT